jgi:hypothetical protein
MVLIKKKKDEQPMFFLTFQYTVGFFALSFVDMIYTAHYVAPEKTDRPQNKATIDILWCLLTYKKQIAAWYFGSVICVTQAMATKWEMRIGAGQCSS